MLEKNKIHLDGILNARELGGYRTHDDRVVKDSVLLRTAALGEMTEADLAVLTESYRVAHVVDFRGSKEREKSADPVIGTAVNHSFPIMNEVLAAQRTGSVSRILRDPDVAYHEKLLAVLDCGVIGEQMYVEYLQDEVGKTGYRAFFRVLLENKEDEAVLWHCTNGKDRTGVAAMLVLAVLGVDHETIIRDFMMTNEAFAAEIAGMRRKLTGQVDESVIEDCLVIGRGVCEHYLQNAIDYAEQEYGSIAEYVKQELFLTDAEIRLLRQKYTSAK